MHIEYTGQPIVSSRSLTITLPIARSLGQADQKKFRDRLGLTSKKFGISFMWPHFNSRTIQLAPTPPSRGKIFPQQMKDILALLGTPAELGFVIDGNA
jgi:hypothetical protein